MGFEEARAEAAVKTEWRSAYFDLARERLSGVLSGKELETAVRVLEAVDKQGIDNFRVHESRTFPGVRLPYTTVKMGEVLREAGIDAAPMEEQGKRKQVKWVVFPAFAMPPYGDPYNAWDMVYDVAMGQLITAVKDMKAGSQPPEILILSSPNCKWGRVTGEYLRAVKDQGFAANGKLMAEVAREFLGEKNEGRVIFEGMSMGASTAAFARAEFADRDIQLLLDNPGVKGGKRRGLGAILRGLQIGAGVFGEGPTRLALDIQARPKGPGPQRESLKDAATILESKGISGNEGDADQMSLKMRSMLLDFVNLAKGSELEGEVNAYVRRGLADPVTFNPIEFPGRFLKWLRQRNPQLKEVPVMMGGGRKDFPIGTTHDIRRLRVKKWGRMVRVALEEAEE